MISKVSLSDQIRSRIIRRIVEGAYRLDERLVELKIAEEFGVSQAPVREAFRQLEAVGFLTTGAGRGSYVSDVLGAGLDNLFTARGALEESATRIATSVLAGDVAELQSSIDAMREAAQARDIIALERHSIAFHRVIMEASRNALLLKLWSSLLIEEHTDITVRLLSGEDLLAVADSHQPIVDAMRAQDAEAAARLARIHQEAFIALVHRSQRRGLQQPG
jgi:DNA-binding GntR family transcriptional regulator